MGRFLVYNVQDILASLKITRTQLTVLGDVSRSDYNRNIYSLGSATNFSIIKTLQGDDAGKMVKAYLAHGKVLSKGKNRGTFAASIQVFVHLEQKVLRSGALPQASSQPTVNYDSLRDTFTRLCARYADNKKASARNRHAPQRARSQKDPAA
ncbi:hypothetical protein EDD21DRAFT_379506 [Dissophora ornata]|nr:hypothetical protein EDD21DRAFT_379506 [Dissophora ornata]